MFFSILDFYINNIGITTQVYSIDRLPLTRMHDYNFCYKNLLKLGAFPTKFTNTILCSKTRRRQPWN